MMSDDNMEKGDPQPDAEVDAEVDVDVDVDAPQAEDETQANKGGAQPGQHTTRDASRRRHFIGFALVAFVVIGLIVGLSIGLTRPDSNDSATSLQQSQSSAAPTPDPPSEATPTLSQFQSVNRAFNVSMNYLSPSVLEGYANQGELKADLVQAVKFFINNFVEEQIRYGRDPYFGVLAEGAGASDDALQAEPMFSDPKGESASGATDYDTNNQNEGVDEADFVKSDGTNVYAAYGDTVVVWNALNGSYITNYTLPAPASSSDGGMVEPATAKSDVWMSYTPTASISGMSLEGGRLVVYAYGYGSEVVAKKNITSACFYDAYATRVLVFDTSPPLTLIAQKDIHGSFRDARAIGNDIHLVTTCGFDFYSLTESLYIFNNIFVNMTDNQYRTKAAKMAEPLIDAFVALMVKDINAHGTADLPKVSLWGSQFGNNTAVVEQTNSGGAIQAFTRLISFSIADLDEEFTVSNAGACTPSSWGYTYVIDGWVVFAAQAWEWNEDMGGTSESSHLMGFRINGTSATPSIIGSFPGNILNQYSLSIYDGHLRVATTIHTWIPEGMNATTVSPNASDPVPVSSWPVFNSVTKNQVIILKIPTASGEMLEEVSRIDNLGKEGETITAINYFGRIAYVVTFERTDPFYVLDLRPSNSKILGELEITGFSAYLHSINSNNTLLVGVGEEADVNGTVLGVKISLFDTANPAVPKQLHNATVERDADTWSSSDVLFDYKAFRWLSLGEGVGIAILPVSVQSWSQNGTGNFDGFYVFDVSRDGISLRLTVSHVESDAFYGCYSSAQLAQRSMVFNGNLTTMKGHSVLSTDLDSGNQTWKLEMPQPSKLDYCSPWVLF